MKSVLLPLVLLIALTGCNAHPQSSVVKAAKPPVAAPVVPTEPSSPDPAAWIESQNISPIDGTTYQARNLFLTDDQKADIQTTLLCSPQDQKLSLTVQVNAPDGSPLMINTDDTTTDLHGNMDLAKGRLEAGHYPVTDLKDEFAMSTYANVMVWDIAYSFSPHTHEVNFSGDDHGDVKGLFPMVIEFYLPIGMMDVTIPAGESSINDVIDHCLQ